MHAMSLGRLGLLLGSLALLLAGCQSTPRLPQKAVSQATAHPPALVWPASGELNFTSTCQDGCASFHLSLTRDHLFRWQRLGAGQQQDDTGRWRQQGDQILLLGQGSRSLQLTLTGDNRLTFQQQPLQASDHSLFADASVILSELVTQDDALLLSPCNTDRRWPLVNNGQYRLLQRLYASSIAQSPGPRRVLAQLHWTDDRQSLSMDRFLSLSPGQCHSP